MTRWIWLAVVPLLLAAAALMACAGLGFTIAKQLVEANGVVISAESEPGEGSRFAFELPLTRDRAAATPEETRSADGQPGG